MKQEPDSSLYEILKRFLVAADNRAGWTNLLVPLGKNR
jgi:hypothetical protein